MSASRGRVVLEASHLSKSFPGVRALCDASLSFRGGEVHALVGENGAGKSTLIKLVSGHLRPDEGTISLDGRVRERLTPSEALKAGVGTISQDAAVAADLTVAENILMGACAGRFLRSRRDERKRASAILDELGIALPLDARVEDLQPAQVEFVAIARAVAIQASVLIFDEPTAALADADTAKLFSLIGRLKAQGVCIIYITHRLNEVFEIADKVTVLRDGRVVSTLRPSETTRDALVRLIVGRPIDSVYPECGRRLGEVVLEASALTGDGVQHVDLSVRRGEVLGIAGLVGSGASDVAKLLVGAVRREGGEIVYEGRSVKMLSPLDAVACGIGYVPADRAGQGVLAQRSVKENISLACLKNLSCFWTVSGRREAMVVGGLVESLKIKVPDISCPASSLSGGNQQKVVLARRLAVKPGMLVLDEPTQGVDVGARCEVYRIVEELTGEGMSIVLVSSDFDELMGLCDRIMVMHEGRVAGVLESRSDFERGLLMRYASGVAA